MISIDKSFTLFHAPDANLISPNLKHSICHEADVVRFDDEQGGQPSKSGVEQCLQFLSSISNQDTGLGGK